MMICTARFRPGLFAVNPVDSAATRCLNSALEACVLPGGQGAVEWASALVSHASETGAVLGLRAVSAITDKFLSNCADGGSLVNNRGRAAALEAFKITAAVKGDDATWLAELSTAARVELADMLLSIDKGDEFGLAQFRHLALTLQPTIHNTERYLSGPGPGLHPGSLRAALKMVVAQELTGLGPLALRALVALSSANQRRTELVAGGAAALFSLLLSEAASSCVYGQDVNSNRWHKVIGFIREVLSGSGVDITSNSGCPLLEKGEWRALAVQVMSLNPLLSLPYLCLVLTLLMI